VELLKSQRVTFGVPCSKYVKIRVTDKSDSSLVYIKKCNKFLNVDLKPGQYDVFISTKRPAQDRLLITTYLYLVGLLHSVLFRRRFMQNS